MLYLRESSVLHPLWMEKVLFKGQSGLKQRKLTAAIL